jgi:hypothetical protein
MKKPLEKNLVLLCMPLIEKGVGSAWGLPVVNAGKERLSALALSEKLQAPGSLSINGNPHRKEQLREMEAMGIGPLGRYLGGEPIKPVRIGPGEFFRNKTEHQTRPPRTQSAATLFCSSVEFEDTKWLEQGTAEELFYSHLEFLRTWGFSGGVCVEKETLPHSLADYIKHLQNKTEKKTKIMILMSNHFFETSLSPMLPNAKRYGDTSAGFIPVNYCAEGKSAARAELEGTAIILYEDIALVLNEQKTRCDILITVKDKEKDNKNILFADISARLKLDITAAKKPPVAVQKNIALNAYLYRNLPSAIPFPKHKAQHYERQAQIGCTFDINAKFSGLRAVDFKEEQSLFYREARNTKKAMDSPPPIRYDAPFSSLNEAQLDFFLRWRSECRRGFITLYLNEKEPKNYIESYCLLYANELVLCMGKEGPIRHFNDLLCLFHACMEPFPETANILCLWLLDFAVLYDITSEAFPLLLDELWNNLWFEKAFAEKEEKTDLIVDLALCHFFVKRQTDSKINYFEPEKVWPLFKFLIPQKILIRKENDKDLPAAFCKTLSVIDQGLRQDWDIGFFSLFYPQLDVESDFSAFENGRALGSSSYTAHRPGFTRHLPLLEICAAIALEPESNPLPGVRARLHPVNLENELLEELREESDAVREILKTETTGVSFDFTSNNTNKLQELRLLPERPALGYAPPDKNALGEFLSLLDDAGKDLIKALNRNNAGTEDASFLITEAAIDAVNDAFYASFGDLLIETGHDGPSISGEYQAILQSWE